MANLKEIRTRLSSVNSTRQITSAMKLVSAAKLRKAQDIILLMRPYARKLQGILSSLAASPEEMEDNQFTKIRPTGRILIVLITSNRGLCGAFNANVIRKTTEYIAAKYPILIKEKKVDFMTVGKKASDYFKYKKIPVAFDKHTLLDKLDYNEIVDTADFLISKYISGDYDRIELVYNQFKNAAVQITSVEAFLPVELKAIAGKGYRNEYFFEPSLHFLVRELIPKTLRTQFYKALLDSNAAEHGARMTAMHQATDNATELLRELKINYNKARQTSITNEIVEIISGAEAQKK